MNTKILDAVLTLCLTTPFTGKAQLTFSNEVGVIAGPLLFQSDFGLRYDTDTNLNNQAWGIGIVHYFNFSYRADCNCYTRDRYFNDHFKLRSEADLHYTPLTHEGKESEKDTPEGRDLRDHKGSSLVFELGMQLEYFPLSLRDFQAGAYKIAPYISLGAHFVSFKPNHSSVQDIPGATPQDIYFDPFLIGDGGDLGGISSNAGTTWALTGSIGIRYKLTILSDLNLEFRYHKYHSDWVDGLNPDPEFYSPNKYDDSIVWLNIGYIYYLN